MADAMVLDSTGDPSTAPAPALPAAGPVVAPEPHPASPWPAPATLPPGLYINRELSWLEFNRRVLDEGFETANPLLERAKFAAIFSSNLDEFFMIRVAGIKRKLAAGIAAPGTDGRTPAEALAAVRATVQALLDRQAALWREHLQPGLAEAGIAVLPYGSIDAAGREALRARFVRDIFPILTPQGIDRGHRFPHVSNDSLNLLVMVRLPAGLRFARVKIPATLPRLVEAPASGDCRRFVWLEEIVAAHLDLLFTGCTIIAAFPFHLTRDADLVLSDDEDDDGAAADLMAEMRESIAQRAFGPPVRVMVDSTMPPDVRGWIEEHLHASADDVYPIDAPLALDALFELRSLDRPDLTDPPLAPRPVPGITPAPAEHPADIFAAIRERDILIHLPYQTFDAVSDFVRAAARDPDVVAIKQTLYRIGRNSPLIPSLIEARDDDTQVAVLVELKARFDEESNISWAERLERHGVHVAYGVTGLKTHCKVTMVVRREPDGLRRYVHLGTGNYNAGTARVYEDLGLLSAREDLGRDVTNLFNVLTGYAADQQLESLWVAPHHLRPRLLEAIAREVDAHHANGGGWLLFKVNALVDRELVRALYAASRAGVRVDLIVRGACCLRPGVPGWSENIRVISVVGRFLEHSRVYAFGNGGDPRVHLGSADLMERNLDRRIEVVFPVEDPALRDYLIETVMPLYLADTVNSRELQPDGTWRRREPLPGEDAVDVQERLAHMDAPAPAPGQPGGRRTSAKR
ncbi:MAG: polyphosphate kinase 1 [Chloroflexota bacterium]